MSGDVWGEEAARGYRESVAAWYEPHVVEPAVDVLARLAGDGSALELGIGSGRVALPLAERGVPVSGIELSPAMVDELRALTGGEAVPVVVGDMTTASAGSGHTVVYLVFNTITNLLTQQEQVACFRNAARHLAPGGYFVVEVFVPALRRLPPGQQACPFAVSDDYLGFDRYDVTEQRLVSHHYRSTAGAVTSFTSRHRYVWPAELDLMAQLAGLLPYERVADWHGRPFTDDSESHVSTWRRPPS